MVGVVWVLVIAHELSEPIEFFGAVGADVLVGVDVYFEEFGGALREELDGVGGGREEDALAAVDGFDGVESFDG